MYPDLSFTDVVMKKQINVLISINNVSSQLIKDCTAFEYNDRPSSNQIVETIQNNDFKLIDGIDDKIDEIKTYLFNEYRIIKKLISTFFFFYFILTCSL